MIKAIFATQRKTESLRRKTQRRETQIDSDNSEVLMPPLVCFAELLANVIVLLHCWVNECKQDLCQNTELGKCLLY